MGPGRTVLDAELELPRLGATPDRKGPAGFGIQSPVGGWPISAAGYEARARVMDTIHVGVLVEELVAEMGTEMIAAEFPFPWALPHSQQHAEAEIVRDHVAVFVQRESWKNGPFDIQLPALRVDAPGLP